MTHRPKARGRLPVPGAFTLTGGCLCRAVRFTSGAPLMKRQCWCTNCQAIACGNASNGVIVATATLSVAGTLTVYRSHADSGAVMVRSFCPTCGVHVLSAAEREPHYVVIRAGALDDLEIARPESVIWTDSAPSWALIDPTVPSCRRHPT